MADLIDREFIKGLGGECIARRDRETGELIAITGIDLLPTAQPAQLGTDLAEVGTDCISREQAIDATWQDTGYTDPFNVMTAIRDRIKQLPPIQPEIVRCKDCKYARLTDDGSCKYCDIWFPDEAEYMDGDYYCASAERKNNG